MQQPHSPGLKVVRVFLADSTRIHAQLLADALMRDPSLKVVGSASRAQEILDSVPITRPDVLIISSRLDEELLLGLDVLRKICVLSPHTRAIVLMDSSKEEAVLEAFRAGARGVFGRHDSLESLCKCVRQVYEGQVWANSEQISFAVAALASAPSVRAIDAKGLNLLSKRELEVVRSLSEGLTNREIAERLGLSQHTIKNYLFRVFDKLGVSSRMELLCLTLNRPLSQISEQNATLGWEGKNGDASFASCQRAAERGVVVAQIALSQMYLEGNGVERDVIAAYMWYLISEQAILEMKDRVSTSKRKLAEALTTEEILEAQKRVSEQLKHAASPRTPTRTGITRAGQMVGTA